MISLLPNEIFFHIFNYVINKEDLLQCQLVCYAFLEPARSTFYKEITIQELRDYKHWNENKSYKLKKFIHTMHQCQSTHNLNINSGNYYRIPPPGRFVQALHIDFEIPLESKFMPTKAEFQLLANACPNVEEIKFPDNMFWNNILSIDTSRYWKKIRNISHTMNETNLQKFLHFRSSLTHLPIHGWQQTENKDLLLNIIQRFSRLETLQIVNRSFSIIHLHDVIPILLQAPHLSGLIMTSSGSPTHYTQQWHSTIRYLELTMTECAPYLTLLSIKDIFPYLNRLILCFTPSTENSVESDDSLVYAVSTLIRFTMNFLSQSQLRLFIHNYNAIHRIARIFFYTFHHIKPNLYISYTNCSSSLTGQPGIYYQKNDDDHKVYLRYQGYFDSDIMPHLDLLRECGQCLYHVSIQAPIASIQKPNEHLHTLLTEYCPQLTILYLSQCYFHLLLPSSLVCPSLSYLTLERCLITSNAFRHLSTLCPSLEYLTINNCFTETEGHVSSVCMPSTRFKKLVIYTEDRQPTNNTNHQKTHLISIQSTTDTLLLYQYCSVTRQLNKIPCLSVFSELEAGPGTVVSLKIQCLSLNEFIFNSTSIRT